MRNILKEVFHKFRDKKVFELREVRHYKRWKTYEAYGGESYYYELNKDIEEWVKENKIRCHWRPNKKRYLMMYFQSTDDVMRFKLTWW